MRDAILALERKVARIPRPSEGVTLLVLCGLAYVVGFVNLLLVTRQPYFQPVVDALYFDVWARRLAAGDWLGLSQGAFFQTPLYPYFMGVTYAVFGNRPGVVLVLQAAAAAGTVAVIYWLGRRLFGRAAATLAALAYALYGPLIMWEATLLKVVWEGLLTAGSLYALLAAEDRPRPWRFAAAGALLALLSALRQNAILLLPLACLYLVWPRRAGGEGAAAGGPAPVPGAHPRARLGWCACLLLGAAVVVAPITARNYAADGSLVPIAASTGQTIYWENHHLEPGDPAYPPRFVRGVALFEESEYRAEAERRLGRPLNTSEVSAYWTRQALRFVLDEPGRYLALCLQRAGEFFSAFEKPDNYNYYFGRRFSPVLSLPLVHFGVLAPLGLVGLCLAMATRRRVGLVTIYVLCYAGTAIPAFVNGRYRFPIVPLLCLCAGFLVARLAGDAWALVRERLVSPRAAAGGRARGARLVQVLALGATVAVIAVACNWGVAARVRASVPSARVNLSDVYLRLGRAEDAVAELDLAVAANPRLSIAHAALGRAYLVLGRYPEALRELDAAVSLNPVYVSPLDLARACAGCGETERAATVLRRALAEREDANLRHFLQELERRPGAAGGDARW